MSSFCIAFKTVVENFDHTAVLDKTIFLSVLNSYGIPVTVGSDAHKPEHVGRHYDKAIEVLKKSGYSSIAYFEGRKRVQKTL